MLQAQSTGFLENGSTYNDSKMIALLKMWAPPDTR
jgi:hypothetical protein